MRKPGSFIKKKGAAKAEPNLKDEAMARRAETAKDKEVNNAAQE